MLIERKGSNFILDSIQYNDRRNGADAVNEERATRIALYDTII